MPGQHAANSAKSCKTGQKPPKISASGGQNIAPTAPITQGPKIAKTSVYTSSGDP